MLSKSTLVAISALYVLKMARQGRQTHGALRAVSYGLAAVFFALLVLVAFG